MIYVKLAYESHDQLAQTIRGNKCVNTTVGMQSLGWLVILSSVQVYSRVYTGPVYLSSCVAGILIFVCHKNGGQCAYMRVIDPQKKINICKILCLEQYASPAAVPWTQCLTLYTCDRSTKNLL